MCRFDYDNDNWHCWRNDTLDLIGEFLERNKTEPEFKGTTAKLVKNKKELLDLDVDKTDYLMGNFHTCLILPFLPVKIFGSCPKMLF